MRPAAKRSAPAQPIIAALSVHNQSGGATKGRPLSAASFCSAAPDGAIGGDTAGDDERGGSTPFLPFGSSEVENRDVHAWRVSTSLDTNGCVRAKDVERDPRPVDQAIDHGLLEARGDVGTAHIGQIRPPA